MIKLTEEQEVAREAIETSRQPVRLLGGAGVGKSTIINHLRTPVIKVAPNNKAAMLINGVTIHNLLSLTLKKQGGKYITIPTKSTPRVPIRDKVVFDESSCIPKDILHKYILPLVPNCVLVGDEAQLNPVGESIIPFMGLSMPEYKLDYVHRFGGELLDVSYQMRACVFDSNKDFCIPNSWASGEFLDLGADDIIIAWRNETVNRYNRRIKLDRFGNNNWHVGERVRVGTYYETKKLQTESEWVILEAKVGKSNGYKCWFITIGDCTVPVVHEDCVEEYNALVSSLLDEQRWQHYWPLKNAFCDIRASYAITAHKSQGSTYSNAFVDYADIFINQNSNEAVRAAYVATTRAKNTVRNLI